jgi:hypothetical protein
MNYPTQPKKAGEKLQSVTLQKGTYSQKAGKQQPEPSCHSEDDFDATAAPRTRALAVIPEYPTHSLAHHC